MHNISSKTHVTGRPPTTARSVHLIIRVHMHLPNKS